MRMRFLRVEIDHNYVCSNNGLFWSLGLILLTPIKLILGMDDNYMPSKVREEITYPFPNSKGATVDVWECISNFIPHITMGLIIYAGIKVNPCQQTRQYMLHH